MRLSAICVSFCEMCVAVYVCFCVLVSECVCVELCVHFAPYKKDFQHLSQVMLSFDLPHLLKNTHVQQKTHHIAVHELSLMPCSTIYTFVRLFFS